MLQIYLAIIDDENDKSRFEELYERYARLMHYAAREILADDRLAEEAVQEAFFRIARNFHRVARSCATCSGQRHFPKRAIASPPNTRFTASAISRV